MTSELPVEAIPIMLTAYPSSPEALSGYPLNGLA